MPRVLKTNGIYKAKCTLTGEPAGTTPQVFADRAKRYGVTTEELLKSYVGRTGAKLLATLVNEKGVKVDEAVKQIRNSFEVKDIGAVHAKIVAKIVDKVTAKADKAAQAAAFNARKEKALKALLGEAPAPAPVPAPAPTAKATETKPAAETPKAAKK